MLKLKTWARGSRKISIRRDKRRAPQRLTKGTDMVSFGPKNAERTGDWKFWWRAGCGLSGEDGKPVCPPGHAYYLDRYRRKAHARSKVLGRRAERHRNNLLWKNKQPMAQW